MATKTIIKKRADKLIAGDRFKLDTIKPSIKEYTVVRTEDSTVDTSVILVYCQEEKDAVYCHKHEKVIIL